jgi:hypothetical protein
LSQDYWIFGLVHHPPFETTHFLSSSILLGQFFRILDNGQSLKTQ